MMELGIEGMMLSPGYSYEKAPDQQHFLGRARTRRLFRAIFPIARRTGTSIFRRCSWNSSWASGTYACTPWGMPTYNIFGWQKPCYLLQDGYADTFDELIRETAWESYGTESGNPHCANCMVHSGYEASAVNDTFGSLERLCRHRQGRRCSIAIAMKALCGCWMSLWNIAQEAPLVQIANADETLEETRA